MRISIQGSPVFLLDIDLKTVELLCRLSELHYDLQCKAASQPGGLLCGWLGVRKHEREERLTLEEGEPFFPLGLQTNFRGLDLTLKICEQAESILSDVREIGVIWRYRQVVKDALERANAARQGWVA